MLQPFPETWYLDPAVKGLHCDILETRSYGRDKLSVLHESVQQVIVVRPEYVPGLFRTLTINQGVPVDAGPGPCEASPEAPPVLLLQRVTCGRVHICAVPVNAFMSGKCLAFGGRYIVGDSRISCLTGGYPVLLHDRHEATPG